MNRSKSPHKPRGSSKTAILLAVVIFITLVLQISTPLASTDIWWHIALGKQILESGSLVIDHSIFTWTTASSSFVYNSWLSDILLYVVDKYLGTTGLMALRFLVFIGILTLAWLFAKKRDVANNPLAWLIVLIAFTFMWGTQLIKPELFSLGFMTIAVWLYYSIRFTGNSGWYLPYLYPPLFILWANVHGAFFLSSLFFISVVIGEILNLKFSRSQAMPAQLRKHFLIALVLCIPAILINPYGYRLPFAIIETVISGQVVGQEYISAYRPTFLLNFPPLFLLDYLIASMLLFVLLIWQKLKVRQTDWVAILAYIVYTILFIQMGRVTYYLGPIFLFTGLDLLTHKEASWVWPKSKWRQHTISILSIAGILFISGRALSLQRCTLSHPAIAIEKTFSTSLTTVEEAANYVEKNIPGKKIGNLYEAGGYLMYRFWPERKTMIDPRAFPFVSWIESYFQFMDGEDIENFVRNKEADFWIVNHAKPAVTSWFSESPDWTLVFVGPSSTVFIPKSNKDTKPEISEKIGTLDNLTIITNVLSLAFDINNLALAQQLQSAIRRMPCKNETVREYETELNEIIIGLRKYSLGEYQEAVNIWAVPRTYLPTKGKAADTLLELSKVYREEGDILKARETYLQILRLFPEVSVPDAYNFALLDWQYRHSVSDNLPSTDDGMHWEPITDVIIENSRKYNQDKTIITETLNRMKAGTYNGDMHFIARDFKLNSEPIAPATKVAPQIK